jgi:hypothetical protein
LGWWRVRHTDLSGAQNAAALHEIYRSLALAGLIQERAIKQVFTLLRRAGVEPLLLKGWAVARLYAQPGLRPLGDIDLLIRPSQDSTAWEVLYSEEGRQYLVDTWHEEYDKLDDRGWDALRARSTVVPLDEAEVRVLGPEDHLAFLCLHCLRHGAWNPLWLCDIGAALESRPPDFDWDLCLGRDRRRADWIACAVGLAHQLLGAEVGGTPVAHRAENLPRWLVAHVLRQWERPDPNEHMPDPLIKHFLRQPGAWPRAARRRWPDPVAATIRTHGPFNDLPRLPFQVWDFSRHTGRFLLRLPELLRESK